MTARCFPEPETRQLKPDRPMPIEIKELHIKTVVENTREPRPGANGAAPADTKALVAQCVEQVMQILEQQKER